MSRPRWRLPLLAAAGILPALVLAGFGFRALDREQAAALHEARAAAGAHAETLARTVHEALLEGPLPSAAEVLAFQAAPGSPAEDPCQRAARATGADAALMVLGETTVPSLDPNPAEPGRSPDPGAVLSPLVEAEWRRAVGESASPPVPPSGPHRRRAWERLAEQAAGTGLAGVAQHHLARALLAEGRTAEAARVLQAILLEHPDARAESGLPLEVLALRGLVQLADLDASIAPPAASVPWWNVLAHRVLVRWRLPASALADLEAGRSPPVRDWLELATRQDAIRARFLEHALRPGRTDDPVPAPAWLPGTNGSPAGLLLSVHPVPGGAWWLLRPRDALLPRLRQVVDQARLPSHLTAELLLAGESTFPGDAPRAAPAFAEASDAELPPGFVRVRLHLTHPDVLAHAQRARARGFGLLIVLAAGMSVVGFLLALLAYVRQRWLTYLQADFTASVSHELRAPLAAVRLLAEELCDLPESEAARRDEYHRLILRETRRLGLLVENVLHHARLDRGGTRLDLAPVDLGAQLVSACECLRATADESGIRFDLALPPEPVTTRADPQALQQILINLIDNALKHSPSGGTVHAGVERLPDSPPRARLYVADHGPGIPPADHERIFWSYYRRGSELRRETAGVGLGLAIVRRLVDAHGGTVRVESQPGAGARFIVDLPLRDLLSPPYRPGPDAQAHEASKARSSTPA